MRIAVAGLVLIGLAGCASSADDSLIVPTDVEVTMSCRVQSDGGLADCRLVRERPGGYGMGAAALAAAEEGRASVQPVGGGPRSGTGGRDDFSIRLPIDAEAMARYRRIRTEVSEPRS